MSAIKPLSYVDTLILSQTLPIMKYPTVLLTSKVTYLLSLFNKGKTRRPGKNGGSHFPRIFSPFQILISNFLRNKYVLKVLRNILSHYLQAYYLPSSDFLAFPICNNEMKINHTLAIFVFSYFFSPLEGLNFNKVATHDTIVLLIHLWNPFTSSDILSYCPGDSKCSIIRRCFFE